MIEAYKELLSEIKIHENLRDAAETNIKYYKRIANSSAPTGISGIGYDDMPKGSKNQMSFGDCAMRFYYWVGQHEMEKNIIEELEGRKQEIDEAINCLDITVKVAKLRAMGLTQEQVAELVDRSPRQVQRIEAKIG